MRLVQAPQMRMICTVCDEDTPHDKDSQCPRAKIERLKPCRINCPKCGGSNKIEVNTSDYYECRKCHTQYCCGMVVAGYDASKLKRDILIDYENNNAIQVVILPEKGNGRMRIDEACVALKKEAKRLLKGKKQ